MAEFEVEEGRGVLRLKGVEVFTLRLATVGFLLKSMHEVLGRGAGAVLYSTGVEIGKTLAARFAGANAGEALRELFDYCATAGWGVFEVAELGPGGEGVVIGRNTFTARIFGDLGEPACHLVRGFLAGVFSKLFGGELVCEGVRCRSAGDEWCEFRLRRAA